MNFLRKISCEKAASSILVEFNVRFIYKINKVDARRRLKSLIAPQV